MPDTIKPAPTGAAFRHPVRSDVDGLAILGTPLAELRGHRFRTADPAANTPSDPAPAPNPAPAPAPAPAAPPAPLPSTDPLVQKQGNYTPEQTAAYIKSLRTEAEQRRDERDAAVAAAETARQERERVLAAFGITPEGGAKPPTPDELQATLAERTTAIEATARENLLLRVAPTVGVDPAKIDRLLDSRAFTAKLSALKSDDRAGVEALAKEALANDGTLAAGPVPAASSGGGGHTGTQPITGRRSMADAVAGKYNGS